MTKCIVSDCSNDESTSFMEDCTECGKPTCSSCRDYDDVCEHCNGTWRPTNYGFGLAEGLVEYNLFS